MRVVRDGAAARVHPRQAGVEGRLADALGLRGRALRALGRRPLLARLVVPGRRPDRATRSSAASPRSARCTPSSASPGRRRCRARAGAVPTPGDALEILEVPVLRWLFARRRPNQAIKVAFDQEIHRLYDEWDALERKVAAGTAGARRDHRRTSARSRTAERRAAAHAAAGGRTGRSRRSSTSPRATRRSSSASSPGSDADARRRAPAARPRRRLGRVLHARGRAHPRCATSPTPPCSPRSTSRTARPSRCCATTSPTTGRSTA